MSDTELLRMLRSDATRQLHAIRRSADGRARAIGLAPGNHAAERAEAGWREENPGLSAVLRWTPRPVPTPPAVVDVLVVEVPAVEPGVDRRSSKGAAQ